MEAQGDVASGAFGNMAASLALEHGGVRPALPEDRDLAAFCETLPDPVDEFPRETAYHPVFLPLGDGVYYLDI